MDLKTIIAVSVLAAGAAHARGQSVEDRFRARGLGGVWDAARLKETTRADGRRALVWPDGTWLDLTPFQFRQVNPTPTPVPAPQPRPSPFPGPKPDRWPDGTPIEPVDEPD